MSIAQRHRVLKGALVAVESCSQELVTGQNMNMFVFQYNPDKLVRTLYRPDCENAPQAQQNAGHESNAPVEIINLTLELDAADQLEKPWKYPQTVENGLHPSLAALELMAHPHPANVGSPEPPLVLFLWGPKRIMPVLLTSLKIVEEAFDRNLNPIRAKIELCMRALKQSELSKGSIGHSAYESYLRQKESLADLYRRISLSHIEDSTGMEALRTFLADQ